MRENEGSSPSRQLADELVRHLPHRPPPGSAASSDDSPATITPVTISPGDCSPAGRAVDPIVEIMATDQGLVEQLQVRHVDDGTGRCRECSAGAGRPRQPWPCTLRALADHAAALPTERLPGRLPGRPSPG